MRPVAPVIRICGRIAFAVNLPVVRSSDNGNSAPCEFGAASKNYCGLFPIFAHDELDAASFCSDCRGCPA